MSPSPRAASPVALTLPLVLALVLTGCGGSAPPAGVRLNVLTGDASGAVDLATAKVGSRTSLRARVTRVLSPRAFVISAADTGTGSPGLVLDDGQAVQPGQVVQVAGFVDVLLDDVARSYGFDGSAALPEFDHRNVVVASMVDTTVLGQGS